jgi:GrpB-like predicted nucleotidyltransferase (UPF0157 family)
VIVAYQRQPPVCRDYDPRAPAVADRVGRLIRSALPEVAVEHVGSTAVPGCAGKGVVDLMVLYPAGRLEAVKEALAALGFQPQAGPNRFPEERPMRLGALAYDGAVFNLHAHVLGASAPEADALRRFRDRLRADPELVAAYVRSKVAALTGGDGPTYQEAKAPFIRAVLGQP